MLCGFEIRSKGVCFFSDASSCCTKHCFQRCFCPLYQALLSAMLLPTLRAFPLDDERDGVGIEPLRQLETRNANILHAERTMARFAIKMNMAIVMVAFPIFLAQLIVQHSSAILERMHRIVFQKERESAEDARLIHRYHLLLQVFETQRILLICQSLHHQYTVGGGLNALRLQFMNNLLCFHFSFLFSHLIAADFKSADPKKVGTFFNGGFQIRRAPGGLHRVFPLGVSFKSPARRLLQVSPLGVSFKSPVRRPAGFAIRRQKMFDLLKPGDLQSPISIHNTTAFLSSRESEALLQTTVRTHPRNWHFHCGRIA